MLCFYWLEAYKPYNNRLQPLRTMVCGATCSNHSLSLHVGKTYYASPYHHLKELMQR